MGGAAAGRAPAAVAWVLTCVAASGAAAQAQSGAASSAVEAALPRDTENPPPVETPHLEQSSLFLERTRFGFRFAGMREPDPAGDILFEASPALHLFLWNPLSRYTALRPDAVNYARVPVAASITFDPQVRMLAQDSEPVRSPSWKLRANMQLFHKHPQAHALKVQMTGFRMSVGHYSNGQEGCPFEVGRLEAEGCAHFDYEGIRGPSDLSLVNRAEGDFSLNHLTLALHHRFVTLQQLGPGMGARGSMPEHRSHTFGVALDRIESAWIGGISHELRSLYGSFAAQIDYRFETRGAWRVIESAGRFALEASAQATFGAAEGVYPVRLRAEIAYTLPAWSDLGVFLSALHGRDDYNLQFVDKIDYQLLVGLVVDLYPRPRHACRATSADGCRLP
jgi:hypothetical protein